MVLITPGIPGKLLEFCNFLPGPWKNHGGTDNFLVLLENAWNFINKPKTTEASDSWFYFLYYFNVDPISGKHFHLGILVIFVAATVVLFWYYFVFVEWDLGLGPGKTNFLPWKIAGILLSVSEHHVDKVLWKPNVRLNILSIPSIQLSITDHRELLLDGAR